MMNILSVRERWATRIHFGLLLLIFGELVAWQDAASYLILDWLATGVIYLALGTICLDIMKRFRASEIKSLLLAGGMFGLLQGTLISSAAVQREDWIVNLLLRALGIEVIMFLLAFTLFQRLALGKDAGYSGLILAAVGGFAWGVWTRWFPELDSIQVAAPSWDNSLPYVIIMLVVGLVFPLFIRHAPQVDWLMTPYEWAATGGVLFVALVLRSDQMPGFNLGVVMMLLLTCGFILAFSSTLRRDSLPESLLPAPPLGSWLLLLIPFALLAWLGYRLSDSAQEPLQARILFQGVLLFGAVWLPLVSVLMGISIFVRLTREGY